VHGKFQDRQTPPSNSLKLIEFETCYTKSNPPLFFRQQSMQWSRNMVHSHFTLRLRARDYINGFPNTRGMAFGWETRVLTITRSRLLAHVWSGLKGGFTLWLKIKRPWISTNLIVRNQEFGLSTFHIKVKVQRLSQYKMFVFLQRRRTLEGSLGRTGMEIRTMVERPLGSFFIKKSIIGKI
jgi:hypothetical protein